MASNQLATVPDVNLVKKLSSHLPQLIRLIQTNKLQFEEQQYRPKNLLHKAKLSLLDYALGIDYSLIRNGILIIISSCTRRLPYGSAYRAQLQSRTILITDNAIQRLTHVIDRLQ
ncbi:unnamed protein product [Rotaria magnacalcarata]|uniref:Uncharacterized protein n=1 Tax=Rotaria magnacalcarata TaxID=392030 RepID=A0A820C0G0_9BILA|nr:unnamed protein product [Rotaria magnacalcarata]CAF4206506.1 unnamed protein product [Rotaria magnacalcarata]CAF4299145.1 unnamed protein product [Rotaria magnacalcarata]